MCTDQVSLAEIFEAESFSRVGDLSRKLQHTTIIFIIMKYTVTTQFFPRTLLSNVGYNKRNVKYSFVFILVMKAAKNSCIFKMSHMNKLTVFTLNDASKPEEKQSSWHWQVFLLQSFTPMHNLYGTFYEAKTTLYIFAIKIIFISLDFTP